MIDAAIDAPLSEGDEHSLEQRRLAELWQLYPVRLQPHDPDWAEWFEIAVAKLDELFGEGVVRVNHIGSTSVPGLIAKPIVDLLVELDTSIDPVDAARRMRGAGCLLVSGSPKRPLHMVFSYGYTPKGFGRLVFHLHLRNPGDWNELYFRDYLRDHPTVARDYAEVKRTAASVFEHDREGYTTAKGAFINAATARARALYGARYAH